MRTPETEDNEKEETTMINQVITNIQNDLLGILDENQMKLLSEVLAKHRPEGSVPKSRYPGRDYEAAGDRRPRP